MATRKTLGVLGGLGPMATACFYEMVTAHTRAAKDQDHIDVVISSRASTPDRTAYVLDHSRPSPYAAMREQAARLAAFGADVLAIPCNTAHFFYDQLAGETPLPVLNMVQSTVAAVRAKGAASALLLATDGTLQGGTYARACKAAGIAARMPAPAAQAEVMRMIYGIKAGDAPDVAGLRRLAEAGLAEGCDMVILGCTELSLIKKAGAADPRYIDSMEVLAREAIVACGAQPFGFDF